MILVLTSLLLACAAEEESIEEHACEHATEAGGALTAGATREDAPELPLDGEPYTVTLVDGASGFLAVPVTGDTAALLFAGTADVVTGFYEGDTAVTLPEAAPIEDCADDIPAHYDLDFHEAGTWYLEVGPAAVSEVWLLLGEGAHGHEE